MSTSAGAARSRSPPKAELAPHGPVAHAGDSRRKLRLRPVVDRELHVFPVFPVVGAQFAGEVQAAACLEQGVAQRLAEAAEGDGLEPPALRIRRETADVAVADDIGPRNPGAAMRKARIRIVRPGLPRPRRPRREFEGAVKAPRFQDRR